MEPVKGISVYWSPEPASSAHILTFITISRLINYIPPLDWPPSGPPASSVSLHYRGIFTLPSTMPPATLTTINISPEPAFLIPHALHIWSVSSDWCRHVFVTYMRLNKKIPNTTANRQDGCGWGHKWAVAMEAAITDMDTMRKGGCRTTGLTSECKQALQAALVGSESWGRDKAGTITRPDHWGGSSWNNSHDGGDENHDWWSS